MIATPPASLFAPLSLPCGLVLKNRFLKSATSELLASDHGAPTARHGRIYARWAEGGSGALVTGNVMVDPARRAARGDVVLGPASSLAPFRAWAGSSRAPLLVQLSHPGRQSPRNVDPHPVAPSALRVKRGIVVFAEPRALAHAEIEAIVRAFADAAARVEEAGFAGVQVHAGHGYLVHQFLSAYTNRRDDTWGGSPRARRRFLDAVVRGIRARVGNRFAVSVKLNVPLEGAADAERAEWLDVLRSLADGGVDLVELSGGTYERDAIFGAAGERRARHEPLFGPQAELARAAIPTPIALTGGIHTIAGARRVIEGGRADLVGLARWLIRDPEMPAALLRGDARPPADVPNALPLGALGAPSELAWYEVALRGLAEPAGTRPTRMAALSQMVRKVTL